MIIRKRIYCWACVIAAMLFLSLTVNLMAQDEKAKTILNSLSDKTKSYSTIQASFTSHLKDKVSDTDIKQTGAIIINGDNYKLTLGDIEVISDGTTLWTYSKESNEVMIDNVADVYDEEGINPSEIFKLWENGFKYNYDSEKTIEGKKCDVVKLHPTEPKEKSYHTIKIFIDKAKTELVRVEIMGKEGDVISYTVDDFQPDPEITAGIFKFNAARHPGVEEIDNR